MIRFTPRQVAFSYCSLHMIIALLKLFLLAVFSLNFGHTCYSVHSARTQTLVLPVRPDADIIASHYSWAAS